jgi:hypothetical protein
MPRKHCLVPLDERPIDRSARSEYPYAHARTQAPSGSDGDGGGGRRHRRRHREPVAVTGGSPVRAIKIVRYAETVPSAVTFEIDAHELCHAIASLQLFKDHPCHAGNGGVLQALETADGTIK